MPFDSHLASGRDHPMSGGRHAFNPSALPAAASSGLLAAVFMLSLYFGILTLVSGWEFTLDQFNTYWPFVIALAIGFGIQVGLFMYLHRAAHAAASGRVVAATGTTSGAAMISCCTHYLVNLLPALGATGLVSFIGQYQSELFWFGIAANLAGIAYIGSRVVSFTRAM
jgi:P-type Cu+ transporter